MVLGDDPELEPTAEELATEEAEEPTMMRNAGFWDDFLNLVAIMQRPWAPPEGDTDEYRQARAVEVFNAGAFGSSNLPPAAAVAAAACLPLPHLTVYCSPHVAAAKVAENYFNLPGSDLSWVEHIGLFVIPRQIVELGDPTRRACDACESLGARFKKIIKHLTCRRALRKDVAAQRRQASTRDFVKESWSQNFSRGYIEQAFARLVVEEGLRHGAENEAFLQREDYRLMTQGLRGVKVESRRGAEPPPSIARALADAVAEDPYAFGP